MKLATWNINSLSVRLPQVLDWLAAQSASGSPVDVLALQELKMTDDKFPVDAFTAAGYCAQWFGQKTYNGVALLSRTPACWTLCLKHDRCPVFSAPACSTA